MSPQADAVWDEEDEEDEDGAEAGEGEGAQRGRPKGKKTRADRNRQARLMTCLYLCLNDLHPGRHPCMSMPRQYWRMLLVSPLWPFLAASTPNCNKYMLQARGKEAAAELAGRRELKRQRTELHNLKGIEAEVAAMEAERERRAARRAAVRAERALVQPPRLGKLRFTDQPLQVPPFWNLLSVLA